MVSCYTLFSNGELAMKVALRSLLLGAITVVLNSVTPAAAVTVDLQYYPLPRPIRLLDTRLGETAACNNPGTPLTGGTPLTLLARGACQGVTIPANAQAVVGNAAVVNFISGPGYINLYPSDAAQPLAANLNYSANDIVSNAFTVGLGSDGTFNTFASSTTHFVVDITGYFAQGNPSPTATAVGVPNGSATSATIGAAGGSVSTPDGKIALTIPAGALASNTVISIQPLTNMAHGKIGAAYRLTPDGQTFLKPVTLTFTYTDEDLLGTAAEFLGAAFQTAAGYWQWAGAATVDTTAKTVSVSSSHFSDWSNVKGLQIRPPKKTVKVSGSVGLQVKVCYPVDDDELT